MYDFKRLSRNLRQSEYEAATALYRQLVAEGYSEVKAIAMVYSAGASDSRADAKHWRNEYHKLKHSMPGPVSDKPTTSPLAAESEEMTNE